MVCMRVGLQHVLNDPVSLVYTPVIFSLMILCYRTMYFTQYWLPPHVRISCCSIICNDDLQPISNCPYLTATVIS